MNDFDPKAGKAIATGVSSGKPRWTVINVYHFDPPLPGGHIWGCEVIGRSMVSGERDRATRLASKKLDTVLSLIDDRSDFGRGAIAQAKEYAEDLATRMVLPDDTDLTRLDDRAMLFWLYDGNKSVNQMATDLGLGESTLRNMLRAGGEVRVPLRRILRFIDRERFAEEMARG